jgi:hypothetical protein
MKRMCWWWVDMICRLLEPHEREAVRGDLAEAGATGGEALLGVLGLVVRRQAALWKDWRPWLALIGMYLIVVILATAPASLARMFAHALQRHSNTVVLGLPYLAIDSLFLLLCCWTAGFVLGSLAGRAAYVTGTLFALYGGWLAYSPSKAVVDLMSWTVLFLLPLSWGVYYGLRRGRLGLRYTILLAAAIATPTVWFVWSAWNSGAPRIGLLASYAFLNWPVGYMILLARRTRRRRGMVSA